MTKIQFQEQEPRHISTGFYRTSDYIPCLGQNSRRLNKNNNNFIDSTLYKKVAF